MLLFNAIKNKQEQGFTLLEVIVIMVIAGVLAVVSAPSLLGWYNRNRLNEAATEMKGIIQQVQRNAIRNSADCIINLGPTGTQEPTFSLNGCSIASDLELDNVTIYHNYNPSEITFDYRGGTNTLGTVVLAIPNSVSDRKCIVTSNLLGLTRSGDHDETVTIDGTTTATRPKASDCETDPFDEKP